MFSYFNLISSVSPCVQEKKSSYSCLTERHLQVMWLEQKYFRKPLKTEEGDIEVLSPGIWNTEAGPDFLKAHIRIGRQEFKGAVEIHLSDENWYHHRHQEDERYDQVILHVSFWKPKERKAIIKKNGVEVRTAYLEESLTIPLARLMQLIDLDLYPYKKFVGSGKCAHHLFKALSPQKIDSLFISASYWRLEQKARFLKERLLDLPLQLVGGMAMALGYKHNADAFLELFLFLLNYRDLPFEELLAIALGCCGFFERQRSNWEASTYYQELQVLWKGQQHQIMHQTQLRLDRIRPFNHPVRRLAYLAKLLQDPLMETIWDNMFQLWESYITGELELNLATQLFQQRLIATIPTYEDLYWNHHYTFEASPHQEFLPLMGGDLKEKILINTYLPLLYSVLQNQKQFNQWQAFQAFYQIFSYSKSSKSQYLTHRFFGDSPKKRLINTVQMEQGAYQLHKDFCLFYEASCEGCSFVERYLSLTSH